MWPRRLSCFFLLLYSCGYCSLLGLGSCRAACLQSSASSASYRPTLSPHHCINPACNISCGEWVQAECTRVMCVCVCVCVRLAAGPCTRVAAGPSTHSPHLRTPACLHTHLLSRSHPFLLVLLTPISCHCQTHLLRWCRRRVSREESRAALRLEESRAALTPLRREQSRAPHKT